MCARVVRPREKAWRLHRPRSCNRARPTNEQAQLRSLRRTMPRRRDLNRLRVPRTLFGQPVFRMSMHVRKWEARRGARTRIWPHQPRPIGASTLWERGAALATEGSSRGVVNFFGWTQQRRCCGIDRCSSPRRLTARPTDRGPNRPTVRPTVEFKPQVAERGPNLAGCNPNSVAPMQLSPKSTHFGRSQPPRSVEPVQV